MKSGAALTRALERYEQDLADYAERHVSHEGAVRTAFQNLLDDCKPDGWKLIHEEDFADAAERRPREPALVAAAPEEVAQRILRRGPLRLHDERVLLEARELRVGLLEPLRTRAGRSARGPPAP